MEVNIGHHIKINKIEGLKSKEIWPMFDSVYPQLGTNGRKNIFSVLVVVMLLWEEHSMLKCSHFEVSMGTIT